MTHYAHDSDGQHFAIRRECHCGLGFDHHASLGVQPPEPPQHAGASYQWHFQDAETHLLSQLAIATATIGDLKAALAARERALTVARIWASIAFVCSWLAIAVSVLAWVLR